MIDLNDYPELKGQNFYLPPTMNNSFKKLKVINKETGKEQIIKDYRLNNALHKFVCVVGEGENKKVNDGTNKIELAKEEKKSTVVPVKKEPVEEKSHVCETCEKPYKTDAALKAHVTRYHKEETE